MTTAEKTPRRTRARRGEGEKLKESILEAAEALLIETGDAESVSIRAVAERVGVTPPSIYLHFTDKDELIFAVCEKHFAELHRIMTEATSEASDPLDALGRMGRAYVAFGVNNPEQYRITFMGRTPHSVDEGHTERLLSNSGFSHLVDVVKSCLDAGHFVPGDPLMIAIDLWVTVHGITSLFIAKPEFPWPDKDELIEHILDTQLTGLLRDGESGA
ncbi:MAG TPA: TetR/AcrR family transcriptional regulator [Actinomycetota bacterium]|nr:TetR/AcrR family transcriptional regulator [Actinomycetota bacterium]